MSAGSVVHGVRVLGAVPVVPSTPDSPLLAAVDTAADRSSDSDDLAAAISDVASRLSFSRLRSNILMPLSIPAGARVLDLGCGTGALTRALAERGAHVTGLDGGLAAAGVAGARTRGLPNCEIVCGRLEDYLEEGHDGEFDMVLLSGVLGNARHGFEDITGSRALLEAARGLLKPAGILVLAVENQLGLKYLLGFPEDHRRVPWVGIDGFRSGRGPAQSLTGESLSRLLADTGFTNQEWLYPYPDHWMATAIAHQSAFTHPAGIGLLKQFVRRPVSEQEGASMLTADAVSAFHTVLDAGIGAATANSFLVVAGGEEASPAASVHDGLLWLSTSDRAAELMDRRTVRAAGGAYTISAVEDRAEVHIPPLVASRAAAAAVLTGRNLEDEVAGVAARAKSPRELQPLLREWWDAARPWLGSGEYHFDVMPRNFIRTDEGELHYVDREWIWTEEVPTSWALLRSLWFLVLERLWPAGATAGLSWSLTTAETVMALARLVEPQVKAGDLDRAIELESEAQSRVLQAPVERERRQLRELLDRPLTLLSQQPPMAQVLERPLIAEAESRDRMVAAEMLELKARDEIIGNRVELNALRRQVKELDAKVRWLRNRSLSTQLGRARTVAAKAKRRIAG